MALVAGTCASSQTHNVNVTGLGALAAEDDDWLFLEHAANKENTSTIPVIQMIVFFIIPPIKIFI